MGENVDVQVQAEDEQRKQDGQNGQNGVQQLVGVQSSVRLVM